MGSVRFVTDCLTISKARQFVTLLSKHLNIREIIMKVFVQAKNESVVINDEIIVTVLEVNDEDVILAVDAPEWVEVCEKEAFERSESMLVHPRCPPCQ